MALDDQIDALYALPPGEFTAARNALAKSLKGQEGAATVKALAKPSVLAWAVNQLYWRDRAVFDRLLAAGRALRASQIARLEGRGREADAAAAAHRTALTTATTAAQTHAADAGLNAPADSLGRMLEALSLAAELPARPGRFVDVVQPAGFEALLGLAPAPRDGDTPAHGAREASPRRVGAETGSTSHGHTALPKGAKAREAQVKERQQAAAALATAEASVRHAKRGLEDAEKAEERARAHVDEARARLAVAESGLNVASRAAADARARLEKAERTLHTLA